MSKTSLFLVYLLIGVVILSLIPTPARYYLMLILVLGGATYINSNEPGGLSTFFGVLTGQQSQQDTIK